MTEHPTKPCEGCQAPILWARATGRKAEAVPLNPEPVAAGSYRINVDTAGDVRCRKLTPTERTTTGFGAKLYQSHLDTCPRADDYRRRYLKGPSNG